MGAGGGAVAGGGALSASRLRLLHDTTMIDAALDLDEPDAPHVSHAPHVPHVPHVSHVPHISHVPHVPHSAHLAAPPALALAL